MSNSKRIQIRGTEHAMPEGARLVSPIDPHQLIEVAVVLKHRQPLPPPNSLGKYLTHTEFANAYGADPAHLQKMREFAREYHLQVLEQGDELLRRTVKLAGTVANMEKAFSIELSSIEHPDGTYRGHAGAIQMPEDCASCVSGVFGLDTRPVVRPHLRHRNTHGAFGSRSGTTSFNPQTVGQLYGFPADATGVGQTIGILEFGGGYRPAEIQEYFGNLGIPAPTMKSISVDHATNRPSTPQSADGEVMLDIEVAGSVAPGVTLAVYFAPNTALGFHDALSSSIHDQLRKPNVISISWGGPESSWTQQSMENFDQVAQEAGLLGITITVASGDSGSSDGVNDGKPHVDFPASCPHVLATGGTRLVAANNAIQSEQVWNDGPRGGATGGGYSTFFSCPEWQAQANRDAQRGVPDVAGNADPDTGYNVLVDGEPMVVGGTSAVAPLWAGLIVLLNQKLNRRLGFVNPALYALNQSSDFREITVGNNGAYSATFGWNACTGLGTPIGTQLLQALQTSTQTSMTAPGMTGETQHHETPARNREHMETRSRT